MLFTIILFRPKTKTITPEVSGVAPRTTTATTTPGAVLPKSAKPKKPPVKVSKKVIKPTRLSVRVSSRPKKQSPKFWKRYIYSLKASQDEKRWLIAVGSCESGFNQYAFNPSGASGLYQIIVKWHPEMRGKLWNGEAQVKYALKKYRAGGQSSWKASKHCWSKMLKEWK